MFFESLFVEIENSKGRNAILGVIYRPNSEPRADLDIYTTTIFDVMDIISKERKKCVIMGDMNIDLLKFESHRKTNEYLDNIFAHGFLPVITKPTRICHSSATLIDHIYTNNITSIGHSGIIITDVADHFGTYYLSHDKNKHNNHGMNQIRSKSTLVNLKIAWMKLILMRFFKCNVRMKLTTLFLIFTILLSNIHFLFAQSAPNQRILKENPGLLMAY